jgi:hypothetical protein
MEAASYSETLIIINWCGILSQNIQFFIKTYFVKDAHLRATEKPAIVVATRHPWCDG